MTHVNQSERRAGYEPVDHTVRRGDAAIYGNAAKGGAEIAVEEINALGGLQFDLHYEDDANDPEKSVNAYNTLKDWIRTPFIHIRPSPDVCRSRKE